MPVAVLLMMVASEAQGIATHRTAADQIQTKNSLKENVEQGLLERQPGQHVIFVRYTEPSPHDEWIYNPADIDAAPVIWARDMGPIENKRLIQYYAGRSFWLFEPEESMIFKPY